MATPPMLRPRAHDDLSSRGAGPDPIGSVTVFLLGLIAMALFVAAILAVYTYSTPGVEVPLVVAIALAFGVVLAINVLGRGVRHLRAGR